MEARTVGRLDKLVLALVVLLIIIATVYLFTRPSDGNFVSWCGFAGVIVGAFHWITSHYFPDPPGADQNDSH